MGDEGQKKNNPRPALTNRGGGFGTRHLLYYNKLSS
jgi:hypothetical protein